MSASGDADPVVQRYRAFFALLDWSVVPERDPRRPWPGTPPHPAAAYVKALLVKLCEGKPFVTDLRTFLVEHPLLVLELGFRPVPLIRAAPYGFAVGRTVPGDRWLRHQQQGSRSRRAGGAAGRGTVAAWMRVGGAGVGGHHRGGRQAPLRLGAGEQPPRCSKFFAPGLRVGSRVTFRDQDAK